jgi:hypothetical protein
LMEISSAMAGSSSTIKTRGVDLMGMGGLQGERHSTFDSM